MSWRLDSRRRFILLALAVAALGCQALLDATRTPTKQSDFDLKMDAAQRADKAFAAVRVHRQLENSRVDLVNDPAGTGLIGPEHSLITNSQGVHDAKLTSLNPNFAGLIVQYFRQAGLEPGDPVAVAVSGSFPGINICLYAALEAMSLRPVVITSVGASMWGANDPDFTWLDMERLFFEKGIFVTRSDAATYGGGNDMGRGLSPNGRALIQQAIERNGITPVQSGNIEEAITNRMSFYEETVRGRPFKMYVNVGGGVASIGSSHNRLLLKTGLSFSSGAHNWPRKGTLLLFSEKGVPVIHLLGLSDLARKHGLPVAPDYQPQPGEGDIFVRNMYRFPLAAAIFVAYCLACVLILAPEIRNGLFDRLTRKRPTVRIALFVFLLVGSGLLPTTPATAATKWLAVSSSDAPGSVCVNSSGRDFAYQELDDFRPAVYRVRGPRRLKLVTRYVFDAQDGHNNSYTVTVIVDGEEALRKTFHPKAHSETRVCGEATEVSALLRGYLNVGRGSHDVEILAVSEGNGKVAARLFRDTKRQAQKTVPFAPEQFLEMVTLQFDSGRHNTYYRFEANSPLGFSMQGPTSLEVFTRLDFDQTMNGSQSYALEVLRDGEVWRTFHFDAKKLSTASYVENPDLLPGTRNKFRITVPSGRHDFEIRCVRPEACGIAAHIRLPASDMEGRP